MSAKSTSASDAHGCSIASQPPSLPYDLLSEPQPTPASSVRGAGRSCQEAARAQRGSWRILPLRGLLQLLPIERPMITGGVHGGGHGAGMGRDGPARKQDAGHRPKDGQSAINKGTVIHHRVHLLSG